MSRTPSAVAFSLVLAACAAPEPEERYGFIARLGRDTVSIEAVSRYPDRIVSEGLDRFPQLRIRRTELDLAPDGTIRRMDMHVRIPSAEPDSGERRIRAEFGPDTVRVRLTDSRGTHTIAMATDGMPTVPHVPQSYSLLERMFTLAAARAADRPDSAVRFRQFYPDREFPRYPVPMHRGMVRVQPGGIAEIRHDWLAGSGVATLDERGRLLTYSGARSTYRVVVDRLAQAPEIEPIAARFVAAERAGGAAPALSLRDTLRARIGDAAFLVDYGRPLARGRTLLGEVIPYDVVWRTGANQATHFSTSVPITLGTIDLEPGTYTLWTLPRREGVTLIVNRQTGQWGTGYGPAHDIGRTALATETLAAPAETFTIAVEPKDQRSGSLVMEWGPFRWTAPIAVR